MSQVGFVIRGVPGFSHAHVTMCLLNKSTDDMQYRTRDSLVACREFALDACEPH